MPLSRLAWRLKTVWQLLGSRLQVRRVGLSLHVSLRPPGRSSRASTPRERARPSDRMPLDPDKWRAIRADVSGLLDGHPRARAVLPALVWVERALGRPDAQRLAKLPSAVRQDALAAIQRLAGHAPTSGLIELSELLSQLGTPQPQSVEVEEASMTMFMDAERAWEESVRQALAPNQPN